MKKINIGSNLDTHWLKGRSFASVVEPLMEKGLTVLEVHLELRFPEIADHIETLCNGAARAGLGINFHAPYLDPPFMYEFSREENESIKADWSPVLEIVNQFAGTNDIRTEMVLHGSHGPYAEMADLLTDTIEISRWILNACPTLYLGIENLPTPRNPNELVKFGENRESVLDAVRKVNHDRCGITWDMGHCVRNKVFELPTEEWMSRVVHVHLHDVDENRQDHWPLVLGSTPYEEWIPALRDRGFEGTITAELNGKLYQDWTLEEIDKNLLMTISKIKHTLDL
jgi:sugar phosphate isomerase/epimerase